MNHSHTYVFGTPRVSLVNEMNEVVGETDVLSAHKGTAKRHRAISVFLFNSKGELLIQKRSEQKIVAGLQWANTCCANVGINESFEECAIRRLREELGITNVSLTTLFTFEYHERLNDEFSEWEIDRVFAGKYEGEILPNRNEVVETQWISIPDLFKDIENNPDKYSLWVKLITSKQEFKELLPTLALKIS